MAKTSLESVLRPLRRVALGGGGVSDARLLERFAGQGDEAAFEGLLLLHGPMVLGLCRHLLHHEQDAEDAFQATFLTLARKAGTITNKEALASWLYKVAYRVACRARRGELSNRMAVLGQAGARGEADVGDLRGVLDEEIAGLAESYRRAVVLCYLQGKTNDEAAQLLGCPKGTVASRLARAREQLRRRLTQRGWSVSTGMVASVLTDKARAVSVPVRLVCSTLSYVTGKPVNSSALSAKVFALSDGVLRMLWLSKMKMAAGIVLALVLAGAGVGLVVRQAWASGDEAQVARKEPAGPAAEAPEARADRPPSSKIAKGQNARRAAELAAKNTAAKNKIDGSGKAITKEINVRDFTSVDVNSAFEVEITRGENFKTTITIDDNLFEYVKALKEDTTLKIQMEGQGRSIFPKAGMRAVITMPHLESLSLGGVSKGTVKGFKSTKRLTFKLNGASSLHGAIAAGKIDCYVSGASSMSLEGSGTDCRLEASGAGRLDLAKFSLENLNVDLSGAATAVASVKNKLDYDISGAATLTYRGEPEIGRSIKSDAASAHQEDK
jgi:RNA polymerase sigma factor (sigma-70 family)